MRWDWGTAISEALAKIGINKERVSSWLGKPCGCPEREAKVNALGYWAKRVLTGKVEKAEEYLDGLLEEK